MSVLPNITNALTDLITSQVRVTPTGITADEVMNNPSNFHGHQGNNDVYVLTANADNFQLFRSFNDFTFISGSNDVASYWGGGNQTIYDYGSGAVLRFSELDQAQVKVYDLENDPTAKIMLYNPQLQDTALRPDGHGGTALGYIDFIGDPNVSAARISFVHTTTNPSQGGLI